MSWVSPILANECLAAEAHQTKVSLKAVACSLTVSPLPKDLLPAPGSTPVGVVDAAGQHNGTPTPWQGHHARSTRRLDGWAKEAGTHGDVP